ncbi:MAG: MBOAT family O-acyltransferase [Planctomycetota bacterium]
MVFTSFTFLLLFLPLVLLGYHAAPLRRRNAVLLGASLLFYGFWRVDFVLLLLLSSAIDFGLARAIHNSSSVARRRGLLTLSVVANLGLLGYFKYFNFAMENLNLALSGFGAPPLWWEEVVLPVGISFYIFQTMSYTIDVYRGHVVPARRFSDFACYVCLFPQLVAGPIVRYQSVAAQLVARDHSVERFARGVFLFALGFNKKVLIANNVAPVVDAVFALDTPGAANAWVGTLSYALQIYFDFSGYSDMAIGLGLFFSFDFPHNFNSPYQARSITEFWRRWHISLSTWLRDYLYIPLGGSQRGRLRTYVNLFVTMLLGGLWHGASWNFVAWGALHGVALAVERALGQRTIYARLPAPVQIAITFTLVALAWIPFRADSWTATCAMFGGLFDTGAATPLVYEASQNIFLLIAAAGSAIALFATNSARHLRELSNFSMGLQLALFVLAVHELAGQGFNPFLYFQF